MAGNLIHVGVIDEGKEGADISRFLPQDIPLLIHPLSAEFAYGLELESIAAEVSVVLILQSRRKILSNRNIQGIRRQFPLAIIISIDGRWNEGLRRSGEIYPGVLHLREGDAEFRVKSLINLLWHGAPVVAQYRPLFSAREELQWWLALSEANIGFESFRSQGVLNLYGNSDAVESLAFGVAAQVNRIRVGPLKQLELLNHENEPGFHVAIASCRADVKYLAQINAFETLDCLIADSITSDERNWIRSFNGCQVLDKPFHNGDVISGLIESIAVRTAFAA